MHNTPRGTWESSLDAGWAAVSVEGRYILGWFD